MRTTLDLDDALMDALMARHPGVSKTEAVESAVRAYLAQSSVSRLRALAGTVDLVDLSESLRAEDRRT